MQTAHSTISRETHFQKGNRLSGSPLRNVLVTQSCPTLCDLMEPARLLCPWNSPGKNPGVRCHSLLQRKSLKASSDERKGKRIPRMVA